MIKRLATPRKGQNAIEIDTRRLQGVVTNREVDTLKTDELHHIINRQLKTWLNLHVHKNRDGTIAVAYGNEPDIWPEDEKVTTL